MSCARDQGPREVFPPSALAVLLAGALLLMALASVLSGCAAFGRAAPALLAGVDEALQYELEAERDRQRQEELRQVQRLVATLRAAHAAAQEAERLATEAAVLAQEEAARAARAAEGAERARAEALQIELRRRLDALGLVEAPAPTPTAPPPAPPALAVPPAPEGP